MADRQCVTCGKDVYQSITEADTRWYHREGSTTLCYPKVHAKPDHLFVRPDPATTIFTSDMLRQNIVNIKSQQDARIEGLEEHYKAHDHTVQDARMELLEIKFGELKSELAVERSTEFMTLESRLEDAENRIMELEGQERPIEAGDSRILAQARMIGKLNGKIAEVGARLSEHRDQHPVMNRPRTAVTVLRLAQKVDDLEAKLAEYAAFPPTMISPGPTALEILGIDKRIEENTERLRSQSLAMGRLTNRTDNAWTAINQHRRLSNPHGK